MRRALSEYDQSKSELEGKTIGGKRQEGNSVLILYLIGCDSMNFLDRYLKPFERKQLDQYQYLGNCPPIPPLTQH